jgi:hypothetical protein
MDHRAGLEKILDPYRVSNSDLFDYPERSQSLYRLRYPEFFCFYVGFLNLLGCPPSLPSNIQGGFYTGGGKAAGA